MVSDVDGPRGGRYRRFLLWRSDRWELCSVEAREVRGCAATESVVYISKSASKMLELGARFFGLLEFTLEAWACCDKGVLFTEDADEAGCYLVMYDRTGPSWNAYTLCGPRKVRRSCIKAVRMWHINITCVEEIEEGG